jgi:hypothetical protein
LENFDDNVDINKTWEIIRENIKISAEENLSNYELNQDKPWFYEECSEILHQRKPNKMNWIQNTS